jgi:AcrR family transcriptional regulator
MEVMARHKETIRDEVKSETRQKLLRAAAEEFATQGFAGANVNRISEAAGYSIGTFYNYFPSKRDLMLAFIDEIGQQHVGFIIQQVQQEREPGDRLNVFFKAGFTFVEAHITPSRAIFNTLNGPDEEFKRRLYQVYQPLFELLSDGILAPGIAQEEFRQVESASTTGLIMLVYLGTASQFDLQGNLWLDAMQVADFVLNALRNG